MSRAGRLFDVVQVLRRTRGPTTAAALAAELGVSSRTLYRDVAALVARGVPIRQEPGVGYVLDPGYFPPPLAFGTDELDAVLLGLKWVEKRADPGMPRPAGGHGRSARDAPAVVLVDDIEAAQTAVAEAGGTISRPVFAFPGGRRFHFLDPSGLELAIMQAD